jgi:hypothetical protein
MQVRVLHGDRKAETNAADRPCAPHHRARNGGRPAWPDWLQTHAMVANRDRDCDVITFDQDVDRMALAVLDGVDRRLRKIRSIRRASTSALHR